MNTVTTKMLIAVLVVAHLLGSLWHGDAHAILEIALPAIKTAFIIVVILIAPVLGAALIWTRFSVLGCWVVALSMVGSVIFGVYHHYVLISIDNVNHLPPGTPEAHTHFSNSAAFIALVAFATSLVALYAAGNLSARGPKAS